MFVLLRNCSVLMIAVLTLLCLPMPGWAQTGTKEAARAAKVSTDLLTVMTSQGVPNQAPAAGVQRLNLFQTDGNTIAIDAVANSAGDGQALLQALQALGLRKGIVLNQRVSGYLPIDKLGELKSIGVLRFARPSYRPIHNVGAVTSQGDAAMRADVARSIYNVDGTGVKVGVLSDSYNSLGGAAAGVNSGDLPANVEVLEDFIDPESIDEGRAMIELIHDVAPGSPQAFHTAFTGDLEFAQGIRDLAAVGCKVITDDVGYFAEPFFQDGPIAQAIDDVVNNSGVTYFSSAGNSARNSYQSAYNPTTPPSLPAGYVNAHNFGGGDKFQSLTLASGQQVIISFQWDDPFFSVSGGAGAQTDMDILVYVGGTFIGAGDDPNIGGDAVELIGLTNRGSTPLVIDFVLAKSEGPDPTLIKWVNFGSTVRTEYNTRSSTVVGHANSLRCIATGAAPFFNTPAFNPALTTATIEPFSSAGGTPILFDTNGARLGSPTVRQKPEITAVDGTNTTFFLSDSGRDPDAFPNFFGTSASAPHAAAVAALMKQEVPAITPATILSTLQSTALDMDDPFTAGFDTGFDFGTGFGFIQADRALLAISPPGTFAITGVTTVSCVTVREDLRTVTFTPQYTGRTGQPISFSIVNELAPTTAPGPYTLNLYTDNPVITLRATQSGTAEEASFAYNWLAACPGDGTPPPGTLAITGVTTVSCVTVREDLRTVTFIPQYTGLNGQPVSFSIVNELSPTTAPGPYTLNLYTDNPVITLKATQSGTAGEASFTYNWLVACNTGSSNARLAALPGSESTAKLAVRLLPNPVSEEFAVTIQGAQGQAVQLQLTDVNGKLLTNTSVDVTTPEHRERLRFSQHRAGLYLLRVSTARQAVTLKVIKQ